MLWGVGVLKEVTCIAGVSQGRFGGFTATYYYFVCELEKLRLAGDVDDFDVLDAALQWLRARRGLDSEDADRVVDLFRASLATWSDEVPIDQEDEEDEDPPAEEEEADDGVPPERGEGFVLVTSRRELSDCTSQVLGDVGWAGCATLMRVRM